MKTVHELTEFLISNGWKEYPIGYTTIYPERLNKLFCKPLLSDKNSSFCLYITDLALHGYIKTFISANIRETTNDGTSYSFECYSIDLEEIERKLEVILNNLENCWLHLKTL